MILVSGRRKTVGLKVTDRDGLVITVPKGLDDGRITEMVGKKSNWIMRKLQEVSEVRNLVAARASLRPESFDLPALAESWRVAYRDTGRNSVTARTEQPGRIVVTGGVSDPELCQGVLRRWLALRAKEAMGARLDLLAKETGIRFQKFIIRSQRTRWGSCSTAGVISLNCALLFLPPEFVRYVMIHELCHMREPNHSPRFWALVKQYEPGSEVIRRSMRDAWKQIPVWANSLRPVGD
ncbi:MAG TPA: SprT family zinc-dependent metalloprotease [Spirochaetia bacterium]|nr:SprT family zinc-dependent metalloprotease [Spirochaetia bacterium]